MRPGEVTYPTLCHDAVGEDLKVGARQRILELGRVHGEAEGTVAGTTAERRQRQSTGERRLHIIAHVRQEGGLLVVAAVVSIVRCWLRMNKGEPGQENVISPPPPSIRARTFHPLLARSCTCCSMSSSS